MATRTCVYISQRRSNSSPASDDAKLILDNLVAPMVMRPGDFSISYHDYEHEPGSISDRMSELILSADLVVADLTEMSSSGYFQLGLRQASDLPVVLTAQQVAILLTAALCTEASAQSYICKLLKDYSFALALTGWQKWRIGLGRAPEAAEGQIVAFG